MAENNKKKTDDNLFLEDFEDEYELPENEYLSPADYLTDEIASSLRGEDQYDVFGKSQEDRDLNEESPNLFEEQLNEEFTPEEVETQRAVNRKFVNRDRKVPIEESPKVQNIRAALEKGVYDYTADVQNFEDHLDYMDAVQDMLLQDPLFILDQLREKKAQKEALNKTERLKAREGKVEIKELCHALDQTFLLIQPGIAPDVMQEISSAMSSLFDISKSVFTQSVLYTDSELAALVGVLNKVCSEKEFLAMAMSKDTYFKFAINYANRLLSRQKPVPQQIIVTLNLLIEANSKILNAIVLEKEEAYAPIRNLIGNMKRNKRL